MARNRCMIRPIHKGTIDMKIELTTLDREILSRHSAGCRGRAMIELAIVDAIIKAGAEAGYHFEIDGEEEEDVTDANALKAALFNLDDAVLLVCRGEKRLGWIRLVFGNDGYDLVSDYTKNLESFMAPINAAADFLN
jgi:hypothetical protein